MKPGTACPKWRKWTESGNSLGYTLRICPASLTPIFSSIEYESLGNQNLHDGFGQVPACAGAMDLELAPSPLDYAVAYAKSRVHFKRAVAWFKGMQFIFEDMAIHL